MNYTKNHSSMVPRYERTVTTTVCTMHIQTEPMLNGESEIQMIKMKKNEKLYVFQV